MEADKTALKRQWNPPHRQDEFIALRNSFALVSPTYNLISFIRSDSWPRLPVASARADEGRCVSRYRAVCRAVQ